MIDKRELILKTLFEILEFMKTNPPDGVETFQTVARNRGLHDQDARPVAILMDGDEVSRLDGDRRGRQRMSPELITLKPQIFIVLKNRKPKNVLTGEDLNAYRIAIIRAIAQDVELLELVGTNGNLAYNGCETDLKSGQLAEGQMKLDFLITYVLDPYQD